MRLFLCDHFSIMEQLDIFGTTIHEYLLIIEPDKKTADKLIEYRKLLNSLTPLSKDSLHSKPHISLCHFEANDFSEELIISKTEQALSSIKCLDIILNGSEKWRNGTFILKINQNQYIHQLQKELSKVFKGVIKTPHLTVARNLSEQFLNNLILDDFDYHGYFACHEIILLKRCVDGPYQIVKKILLPNE